MFTCVSDMDYNNKRSMTFEEAKCAIDALIPIMSKGEKYLSFLGGEPFCGDRFIEIVEYAYEQGFRIGLSTNATLLDDGIVERLGKCEVNVQISLDGITKDSHEEVRGKNTWNKAMDTIYLLDKYNVNSQTNFVYHKKNIDDIEKYLDFAKEKNIKKVRLTSLMDMGNATKNNMQQVDLDVFVDKMIELFSKRPDLIDIVDNTSFIGLVVSVKFSNKLISCGAGVITLTISPNGDIYPCLNLYSEGFKMANIFENDLSEKITTAENYKLFKELNVESLNNVCAICKFRFFCGGKCRGETYQLKRDLFAPYPECEKFIKALIKIMWFIVDNPEFGERKFEEILKDSGTYIFHNS